MSRLRSRSRSRKKFDLITEDDFMDPEDIELESEGTGFMELPEKREGLEQLLRVFKARACALEAEDASEPEDDERLPVMMADGDQIFKATRLIFEAFGRMGFDSGIRTHSNHSAVTVSATGKYTRLVGEFISRDDDNDVYVRFRHILTAPEEKISFVIVLVNKINNKYRIAKFILEEKGKLTVETDFLMSIRDEDLGKCAYECFSKLVQIINEEYPALMEMIWA